jgi:enhancing lycopene biosynthesis protein 2
MVRDRARHFEVCTMTTSSSTHAIPREKTIKTIGVILSGCGYLDGAEIHEAVIALLALDRGGVKLRVYAPDVTLDEVDHLTQQPTGAKRRVLVEAARIARSKVHDLAGARGTDVDGWVLPGGFGAAKNLCDFADKGGQASVHKDVARVLREAFAARLPVGACCIAPAVVAAVAKQTGAHLRLTIGDDADTAQKIAAMGHTHVTCKVTDIAVDEDRRVVTAPAYMFDAPIGEVATGIEKMVKQVIAWA